MLLMLLTHPDTCTYYISAASIQWKPLAAAAAAAAATEVEGGRRDPAQQL